MEILELSVKDHAHAFIAFLSASYIGLSARYQLKWIFAIRDKKIQNASHAWADFILQWSSSAGWGLIYQTEFHQMIVMSFKILRLNPVLTMLM